MNYEKYENILQIGFFPRLGNLSGAKKTHTAKQPNYASVLSLMFSQRLDLLSIVNRDLPIKGKLNWPYVVRDKMAQH